MAVLGLLYLYQIVPPCSVHLTRSISDLKGIIKVPYKRFIFNSTVRMGWRLIKNCRAPHDRQIRWENVGLCELTLNHFKPVARQ